MKRLLSALVLIPLVLWLVLGGGELVVGGVLALVAAGLLWEWQGLWPPRREPVPLPPSPPLGRYLPLAAGGVALLGVGVWLPGTLALPLFLGMALAAVGWLVVAMVRFPAGSPGFGFPVLHALFGLVYAVPPLVLLFHSWREPHGPWLILLLLVVIWSTDSGALAVGKGWGRRPMAPLLSPKKTWEGAWGGTLVAVLAGVGVSQVFPFPFTMGQGIVLSLLISVAAQVGDLAESLVKRQAGVKDSGALIPGHGGLLDRLDSLLFAVQPLALHSWGGGLLGG